VPEDVSVVGFDDHELADVVGLTTVAQPVADQGAEAARLLLRQLDEPDGAPPGHVRMPIRLVLRETTAPPRPRGPQ
jgi:DNA-binding LacI/PurR family transcriptional regulator